MDNQNSDLIIKLLNNINIEIINIKSSINDTNNKIDKIENKIEDCENNTLNYLSDIETQIEDLIEKSSTRESPITILPKKINLLKRKKTDNSLNELKELKELKDNIYEYIKQNTNLVNNIEKQINKSLNNHLETSKKMLNSYQQSSINQSNDLINQFEELNEIVEGLSDNSEDKINHLEDLITILEENNQKLENQNNKLEIETNKMSKMNIMYANLFVTAIENFDEASNTLNDITDIKTNEIRDTLNELNEIKSVMYDSKKIINNTSIKLDDKYKEFNILMEKFKPELLIEFNRNTKDIGDFGKKINNMLQTKWDILNSVFIKQTSDMGIAIKKIITEQLCNSFKDRLLIERTHIVKLIQIFNEATKTFSTTLTNSSILSKDLRILTNLFSDIYNDFLAFFGRHDEQLIDLKKKPLTSKLSIKSDIKFNPIITPYTDKEMGIGNFLSFDQIEETNRRIESIGMECEDVRRFDIAKKKQTDIVESLLNNITEINIPLETLEMELRATKFIKINEEFTKIRYNEIANDMLELIEEDKFFANELETEKLRDLKFDELSSRTIQQRNSRSIKEFRIIKESQKEIQLHREQQREEKKIKKTKDTDEKKIKRFKQIKKEPSLDNIANIINT